MAGQGALLVSPLQSTTRKTSTTPHRGACLTHQGTTVLHTRVHLRRVEWNAWKRCNWRISIGSACNSGPWTTAAEPTGPESPAAAREASPLTPASHLPGHPQPQITGQQGHWGLGPCPSSWLQSHPQLWRRILHLQWVSLEAWEYWTRQRRTWPRCLLLAVPLLLQWRSVWLRGYQMRPPS